MVYQERVKCLGYTSNTLNFIKHWSQFAEAKYKTKKYDYKWRKLLISN